MSKISKAKEEEELPGTTSAAKSKRSVAKSMLSKISKTSKKSQAAESIADSQTSRPRRGRKPNVVPEPVVEESSDEAQSVSNF